MTHAEHGALRQAYALFQHGKTGEAESILLSLLKRHPKDWMSLTLYARILRKRGEPREGLRVAERALAQSATEPDVLLTAGQCAFDSAKFEVAERHLGILRNRFPENSRFAHLHSLALLGMGEEERALHLAKAGAEQMPTRDTLRHLLDLQMRLERYEEAVPTSTRLLYLASDQYPSRLALAIATSCLGRWEETEAHWSAAQASSPDPAQTHLERGSVQRSWGRFAEAEGEFRAALSLRPTLGAAYQSIFASRKIGEQDLGLIEQAEATLANPATLPDSRRYIHFGLGKAYEDLGRFAEAMSHFDQGNRLIREIFYKGRPCPSEEIEAPVRDNLRVFTKEFMEAQVPQGSHSELPVFVVGMMRSGTTLVEQILSAHSEVGGAGEQMYWPRLAPRLVDYQARLLHRPAMSDAAERYLRLLETIAPGARRVIDKHPRNLHQVGLIHCALPQAKFIYVRRKDVDVAISIWTTFNNTDAPCMGDRKAIVSTIRAAHRLGEHWLQSLPAETVMPVDYEDLVTDPETGIRRLVQFCGLEWSAACLSPESNLRSVRTPSVQQVRQKISPVSVERYRRYESWLGPFAKLVTTK